MSDAASHGPAQKQSPDELTLRARPRAVTRLNRKVLIALVGAGLVLIFGATYYALDPPKFGGRTQEELYNINSKDRAEELEGLPKTYGDYRPPQLGEPLPGELGQAVLRTEQEAGLQPLPAYGNPQPFNSDPFADAMRAERIRQAQQAQQARESQVFFQLSQRMAGSQATDPGPSQPAAFGPLPPTSPTANEGDEQNSLGLGRGEDPNLQGRKLDFLVQQPSGDIYNPYAQQDPASPYQVMAGTIIAASLITGINSDLPGEIIAQVTESVYDTVTGHHTLIPQGTRLLGKYDSLVAFGQERALVVWQRMILPDGSSVVIDNLPATDVAGYAGLEDEVDFHTWRLVKGIALSTLLSIGTEIAFNDNDSDLVQALRRGSQDSINQAGQTIVERNLGIQPTITVRPGWPLRVIVHKDIILRPFRG